MTVAERSGAAHLDLTGAPGDFTGLDSYKNLAPSYRLRPCSYRKPARLYEVRLDKASTGKELYKSSAALYRGREDWTPERPIGGWEHLNGGYRRLPYIET